MLFVRSENLKAGMRLAKPIYNKNGVLLYERNTKLSEQGVYSIKNFGLLGIYILEPAEPVPPMGEEEIEFERFQTVSIFMLKDGLDCAIKGKQTGSMSLLANNIIESYGSLDHRITFIQNIRSKDDYIYKHSLNVAILGALIAGRMDLALKEKEDIVLAALYHDIGKLMIPKSITGKGIELTEQEEKLKKYELEGLNLLDYIDNISQESKGIILMYFKTESGTSYIPNKKSENLDTALKVLKVANDFDKLTAMNFENGPSSEISAIRHMLFEKESYDEKIVEALLNSLKILIAGTTVELTNREKGIVLVENTEDVLKPMVLDFASNNILNLDDSSVHKEVQIKDIMKTMDNRYVIDRELAKEYLKPVAASQ